MSLAICRIAVHPKVIDSMDEKRANVRDMSESIFGYLVKQCRGRE
jgi:hypothetical protein